MILIIDEVVFNHSWITMEQMMDMITIAEMTSAPSPSISLLLPVTGRRVLGSAAATSA